MRFDILAKPNGPRQMNSMSHKEAEVKVRVSDPAALQRCKQAGL